jgi:hypothetical protein
MKPGPARQRSAIESALLDYHRSPGKYALIRKEPPLLFGSVGEILQLAKGSSPEGVAPAPSAAVQQAASFFIRTALLYPDADHYALLGLDHRASAMAVKGRYRVMMRLMHPDYSGTLSGASWPADAAARLNRAYEVLSSQVQRREYDGRRDAPAASRPPQTQLRTVRDFKPAARQTTNGDARRGLKRLATVFGAAGALALILALYVGISGEKETLVQRATKSTATAVVAALTESTILSALPAPAVPIDSVEPSVQPPALARPAVVLEPRPFAEPPRITAVASLVPAPAAVPAAAPTTTEVLLAAPAPAPAPVAVAVPLPPPPVVAAPVLPRVAPAPAAPPSAVAALPRAPAAKPAPNPGLTLAEVHPLLSKLLQQMESGLGDRMLSLLDGEARNAPAAQALLRHYNSLVDGAHPVKLSHIRFKAEPREGRLLVTGQVLMQTGDQPAGTLGKPFSVQAEFASREGIVVMTRLAQAQDN